MELNFDTTLTGKELRRFLAYQGNIKTGPHALTEKICHWMYCKHCGLLALRNEVTRKALKQACRWEE